MDALGPIIVAFIVLIYYGLRIVFQPFIKRKPSSEDSYSFNEEENYETPRTTLYDETHQDFAFNDPLEESPPPSVQKQRQASMETSTKTRLTQPRLELKKLLSQLKEELSNPNSRKTQPADVSSAPHSSPDASDEGFFASDSSETENSTPYNNEVSEIEAPPLYGNTPSARQSKPLTQPIYNAKQLLKVKLNSPHKKKFLRQMIIMNEILDKPLSLRKPRENTKHF